MDALSAKTAGQWWIGGLAAFRQKSLHFHTWMTRLPGYTDRRKNSLRLLSLLEQYGTAMCRWQMRVGIIVFLRIAHTELSIEARNAKHGLWQDPHAIPPVGKLISISITYGSSAGYCANKGRTSCYSYKKFSPIGRFLLYAWSLVVTHWQQRLCRITVTFVLAHCLW
jgi:hypothetical protein